MKHYVLYLKVIFVIFENHYTEKLNNYSKILNWPCPAFFKTYLCKHIIGISR